MTQYAEKRSAVDDRLFLQLEHSRLGNEQPHGFFRVLTLHNENERTRLQRADQDVAALSRIIEIQRDSLERYERELAALVK